MKRTVAGCLIIFLLVLVGGCAYSEWNRQQGEMHLKMGIAFLESAQYHGAMKELLEANKFAPDDPRVHYYLGISYHGKGMAEAAAGEFSRAVELKPDYSEASNYLGAVYLEMGLWDRAIESFQRAVSNVLYDTPSVALYNMGWAYYRKGDCRMATQKYEEAIRTQPSSALLPLIEKGMGLASLDQGDTNDAIRHFRRSLEAAPFLVESHFWLGESYGRLKNREEAVKSFETVIKMSPDTELGLRAKSRLENLR